MIATNFPARANNVLIDVHRLTFLYKFIRYIIPLETLETRGRYFDITGIPRDFFLFLPKMYRRNAYIFRVPSI